MGALSVSLIGRIANSWGIGFLHCGLSIDAIDQFLNRAKLRCNKK